MSRGRALLPRPVGWRSPLARAPPAPGRRRARCSTVLVTPRTSRSRASSGICRTRRACQCSHARPSKIRARRSRAGIMYPRRGMRARKGRLATLQQTMGNMHAPAQSTTASLAQRPGGRSRPCA
ncbi:hypothetical protein PsYK624_054610 [Phanerochaete sordida]|uniref:Uncharacterized protein n=1 Tax=Phanerochaete sordida TaxID=48140 RepID=A0A9P3G546_9APHY|nr:hypothetical protein PsYK624_054610 [Phanerochaete sordida]